MLLELEAALKAAGDPTRTRILKLLEAGAVRLPGAGGAGARAVDGLEAPDAAQGRGLVTDRRDGRWIHYALAAEERNPYARAVLALLRGPLDRDPRCSRTAGGCAG